MEKNRFDDIYRIIKEQILITKSNKRENSMLLSLISVITKVVL